MKQSLSSTPDPQQLQKKSATSTYLPEPGPMMTPVSQILSLQQTLGNSAVGRLLSGTGPSLPGFQAPQAGAVPAPAAPQAAAPQAASEPAAAQPVDQPALPAGISQSLVDAQFKADLRDNVRFRMSSAFTTFVDACRNVILQERAKAKDTADAGLLLTLIDMAVGFYAPGLIAMLPLKAIQNELKGVASLALSKLNNSGLTTYTYMQADALVNQYITLDYAKVKSGFLAATGKVRGDLKQKASSVYTQVSNEEVINKLKDEFRVAVQEISDNLIASSDAEIMGLLQVYDARATGQGVYEGQIRDFVRQYEDLDKFTEDEQKLNQPFEWQRYRIVKLDAHGGRLLAVLEKHPGRYLQTRTHWTFHQYISPEMLTAAEDKAKEQPGGLEVFKPEAGTWYRGAPLVGPVPKPVAEEPRIAMLDAWGKPRLATIQRLGDTVRFLNWVKKEDADWAEVKGARQAGGIERLVDRDITGPLPRP